MARLDRRATPALGRAVALAGLRDHGVLDLPSAHLGDAAARP